MPDEYTPEDIERILAARASGALPGEIARQMNEPPNPDEVRRRRAEAAAALHSDAVSAGTVPPEDPVEAALRAGHAAGGRGTRDGLTATLDSLFAAAQRGDERVTHTGVVDPDTRDRWMRDARDRSVRSRDASRERK